MLVKYNFLFYTSFIRNMS